MIWHAPEIHSEIGERGLSENAMFRIRLENFFACYLWFLWIKKVSGLSIFTYSEQLFPFPKVLCIVTLTSVISSRQVWYQCGPLVYRKWMNTLIFISNRQKRCNLSQMSLDLMLQSNHRELRTLFETGLVKFVHSTAVTIWYRISNILFQQADFGMKRFYLSS